MTCDACDGERVVVLGTGAQADFFPCPVCVGLALADLTLDYRQDAEAMIARCAKIAACPHTTSIDTMPPICGLCGAIDPWST